MGEKISTLCNLFTYLKSKKKKNYMFLYLCDIIQEPGRHGSASCPDDKDTYLLNFFFFTHLQASSELTLPLMSTTT